MPLSKFEHLNMGCKIYRINDFRNVFPRILWIEKLTDFCFFTKLLTLYNVNCNESLKFYYNAGIYTENIFHLSSLSLYSQVFFFSGRFSKFSVHRRKSKIGSFLQKSFSWPWNSVIYTYLYCENNPLQWKMKRSWKEYELLSFSFSFDVSYILVKGEASKEWSRLCFFWQFTSYLPMVVSWFFLIRVFHSSVCK